MLMPYGSLIVGFCCGIISTLGYIFITVQHICILMCFPYNEISSAVPAVGNLEIGSKSAQTPSFMAFPSEILKGKTCTSFSAICPHLAFHGEALEDPGHMRHPQPARHARSDWRHRGGHHCRSCIGISLRRGRVSEREFFWPEVQISNRTS